MENFKRTEKKIKKRILFLPGDLVVLRAAARGCTCYIKLVVNEMGFVLGRTILYDKQNEIACKPGSLALIISVAQCEGMLPTEPRWAFAVVNGKLLWIPGWNMRRIENYCDAAA